MLEVIDKGQSSKKHPHPLLFVHGAFHSGWCWDVNCLDFFAERLGTKEPEGVSYAEEDDGGVEALRCIPADSDPEAVLLAMFGHTFPPKA
jgi:hypothetical protein